MSATSPPTIINERFDHAAFVSWTKSSTSTPTMGSNPARQVNIVDADWRPDFDMDDHNRMCRQLGIVPQSDIVAEKEKAARAAAKEPALKTENVNTSFRLRTFYTFSHFKCRIKKRLPSFLFFYNY